MAGAGIMAGKARRGREQNLVAAKTGGGAERVGATSDRHRRVFRPPGACGQGGDVRLEAVIEIEPGRVHPPGGGMLAQAGEAILRHHASHRDSLGRELLETLGIGAGGRDDGAAPAGEHAQPDIVMFGALQLLGPALSHLHAKRGAADQHRVGRIGAAAPGQGEQLFEQGDAHAASRSAISASSGICWAGPIAARV